MPVEATRLIRKMRGGAQAHLLECGDGHFYVVKFRNNPQHRRILINEWIASVFLNYLKISTPPAAIVSLSPGFLEANPDIHIQLGSQASGGGTRLAFRIALSRRPRQNHGLRLSARRRCSTR